METVAMLAAKPSEHQKSLWWEFIAIKDEPVLMGNALVWMGWCPLCDEVRDEENLTARFDFRRGLLYCEASERSCFDKRSMSLSNALVEMGKHGQR